ncbi:AAC(3) family N-acetyltransferase [Vibrio sp. VB16]|uniref:AAC(3) family N-acetyltransferase n=1 Tax=Vibrio sp. VB16 TaxID=2785746 RepID=UPI0018A00755|nr:AAC(3) family N-acetyltransferase [Vibrio sp. VB16]UGA54976.1 AAC(3) family N-acetyltransferase [Vibrio sp. VB16]
MNSKAIRILCEKWASSGVDKGDTLLLHSNIKRTLIEARRAGYKITPHDILDSLLLSLGKDGTLVLPLFNFDFTQGVNFDIRTTPSHMGALTEIGRTFNESVRTGHPIYSFSVIGKNAKFFEGVDNVSGYAEDSPFGILKSLNGKIASLDLEDQSSMTYYHHIEEIKQVNYRYFKTFSGNYTDAQGLQSLKKYKLFVRDIEKRVITNVNPAGELLWKNGLYAGSRPKVESGMRIINAQKMFNFVSEIIDKNEALDVLYSIEAQL